jgi:hypothetical protein
LTIPEAEIESNKKTKSILKGLRWKILYCRYLEYFFYQGALN